MRIYRILYYHINNDTFSINLKDITDINEVSDKLISLINNPLSSLTQIENKLVIAKINGLFPPPLRMEFEDYSLLVALKKKMYIKAKMNIYSLFLFVNLI